MIHFCKPQGNTRDILIMPLYPEHTLCHGHKPVAISSLEALKLVAASEMCIHPNESLELHERHHGTDTGKGTMHHVPQPTVH